MVLERIIAVSIGSLLIGIAINGFIIPNHLMEGGMIGIGLIAKYRWGYETGLTIIILSLPIYLFMLFYQRSLFINSIHGLLLSSFFIDLLHPIRNTFHLSILESSIIGGLIIGSGIGIMLRYKTSSGGIDLFALFLAKIFPINVGFIIFLFDFAIIVTGALLIKNTSLFYSMITVISIGIVTTLFTYSFEKNNTM